MVLGDLDSYIQKSESRSLYVWCKWVLTPYIKINVKWIKYLNISSDTIKVLEENICRKISDIPRSNIFTDTSSRARDIKESINKWHYIQWKIFRTAKENIKIKREPTVWENMFANDTSDKGLISKIYKDLIWLNTSKTNNPTYKIGKEPEQILLQGGHTEGP